MDQRLTETPYARRGLLGLRRYPGATIIIVMDDSAVHHPFQEISSRKRFLSVSPLRSVKRKTWYYGMRCACARLLALCEDCFAGKGDEQVLHLPKPLTVTCECGAVTEAHVLQKFKSP